MTVTASASTVSFPECGAGRPDGEYILIPAFNEAGKIGEVIADLSACGYTRVVVVDDGSRDDTAGRARGAGAVVLRHPINCGVGAATATGLAYLSKICAAAAATFDADGQHDPRDLAAVFAPIYDDGADVVIGSRMLNPEGMPRIRRIAQRLASWSTFLLFGQWSTDSQSGLKAFSRRALGAIQLKTNRYEVCSEIIAEIRRRKLVMREVPVRAIYTEYSLSKGQGFTVGLKTLARLFIDRILHW